MPPRCDFGVEIKRWWNNCDRKSSSMWLDLGPKNEIRMTSDVDSDRLFSRWNIMTYSYSVYLRLFRCTALWLKDSLLEWVWITPCRRFCFSNYQDGLLVRCLIQFWLLCASLPCTGAVSTLTSMEDEPQPSALFAEGGYSDLSESHNQPAPQPKSSRTSAFTCESWKITFLRLPALNKAQVAHVKK